MKQLINDWKKSSKEYRDLGLKSNDPLLQEGLLCRAEVYSYCAGKLEVLFHRQKSHYVKNATGGQP